MKYPSILTRHVQKRDKTLQRRKRETKSHPRIIKTWYQRKRRPNWTPGKENTRVQETHQWPVKDKRSTQLSYSWDEKITWTQRRADRDSQGWAGTTWTWVWEDVEDQQDLGLKGKGIKAEDIGTYI